MTILDGLKHLVFATPGFAACEFFSAIIRRADALGFEAATITSVHGTTVPQDIRNKERVNFDDTDLAKILWREASALFLAPFKMDWTAEVNEKFRVYRYTPNQFFNWHQDGVYEAPSGLRSMYTMMTFFSEGFEGGGTSFADVFSLNIFDDFTTAPETGKALFFSPSDLSSW
jgi:hypothetical protein